MWRFSHTVVSCSADLNTKSGHLLLTGHIPIYVSTVGYSHIQVFDLWVKDSFDNAAPSYSNQGVPPGKLSIQFRRCQIVRARADHWSHYSTWILLSWCCVVACICGCAPSAKPLGSRNAYSSHDGTMHSLNNDCLHIIQCVFTLRRGVHIVHVQPSDSGRILNTCL